MSSKTITRCILCLSLLTGSLFVAGCATGGSTTTAKKKGVKLPPGDQLAVVNLSPASGTVLNHNQNVSINVAYRLDSAENAVLLVRPYTKGRQSSGYIAHQAVPCIKGQSEAEAWFTFRKNAEVDEIRVTLVDNTARRLLTAITNAYQASWSDSK